MPEPIEMDLTPFNIIRKRVLPTGDTATAPLGVIVAVLNNPPDSHTGCPFCVLATSPRGCSGDKPPRTPWDRICDAFGFPTAHACLRGYHWERV